MSHPVCVNKTNNLENKILTPLNTFARVFRKIYSNQTILSDGKNLIVCYYFTKIKFFRTNKRYCFNKKLALVKFSYKIW